MIPDVVFFLCRQNGECNIILEMCLFGMISDVYWHSDCVKNDYTF